MINRIKHWGHLLCPRMKFEDFVARVESLGDKRMVKVSLIVSYKEVGNFRMLN